MVAADDIKLRAETAEEVARKLEALGRAGVQRAGPSAVLRLSEVTQGHNELVGLSLREDLFEVALALVGVIEITRIELRYKARTATAQRTYQEGGSTRLAF